MLVTEDFNQRDLLVLYLKTKGEMLKTARDAKGGGCGGLEKGQI
jgi:hypothetical protein